MDDVNRTSAKAAPKRSHRYNVVAAIEQVETDRVVAELGNSGFDPERIDVITAEDMQHTEPIGGSGVRGFLTRLGLSLGADLDTYERAGRELQVGHALVMVEAHGDEEQTRAQDTLRRHGGHNMVYFGRWTITELESDAH